MQGHNRRGSESWYRRWEESGVDRGRRYLLHLLLTRQTEVDEGNHDGRRGQ